MVNAISIGLLLFPTLITAMVPTGNGYDELAKGLVDLVKNEITTHEYSVVDMTMCSVPEVTAMAESCRDILNATAPAVAKRNAACDQGLSDLLDEIRENLEERIVKANLPIPDPCLANPCQNAGTCNVNQVTGTYICTCPTRFAGVNCEKYSCSIGWRGPFEDECYKRYLSANYNQGAGKCGELGGGAHLPVPVTPAEEMALYDRVIEDYTCSNGNHVWVNATYVDNMWRWGGIVPLTPQPAHTNGKDCLAQWQPCSGGYLSGQACGAQLALYCVKQAE